MPSLQAVGKLQLPPMLQHPPKVLDCAQNELVLQVTVRANGSGQ